MNSTTTTTQIQPVLQAKNLTKRFGHVIALDGADFELYPGEILAVIGDNGAGKSTLIKMFSGAMQPDEGEIRINGKLVHINGPLDARSYGIETVYQDLAMAPSLNIMDNLFLGREYLRNDIWGKFFRMKDNKRMLEEASHHMDSLKMNIQSMKQAIENLSGGQRQGVAVVRSKAFAKNVIIMDEPTAALGVKESGMVEDLIRRIKEKGLAIILISHNMPQVFSLADRIHIHRLGKRLRVVSPKDYEIKEVVAMMTGAEIP